MFIGAAGLVELTISILRFIESQDDLFCTEFHWHVFCLYPGGNSWDEDKVWTLYKFFSIRGPSISTTNNA
jgi:hypothetical protein